MESCNTDRYRLVIANKNYSSWSLRPWLLMRECGIDFEEIRFDFDPVSNRERFRQYSPTGKVPCLLDGERAVWDSLAIVEYLAERHPGVWPEAGDARAWARCASAEMHAGFAALREECSMSIGVRVHLRTVSPALKQDLERIEELWNDGIDRFGGPFLAGSRFSAVDAFYAPVAFRLQTYGLRLGPVAAGYAALLLSLPHAQDWERAALAETARDLPHDEDVLRYGMVTDDLRAPPR